MDGQALYDDEINAASGDEEKETNSTRGDRRLAGA